MPQFKIILPIILLTGTVLILLFAASSGSKNHQLTNQPVPTGISQTLPAEKPSPVVTLNTYQNPFDYETSQEATLPLAMSYPITELGGCRDSRECFLYCEIGKHTPECWSYGTFVLNKNVLGAHTGSQEEESAISLPCNTSESCHVYCKDHPSLCPGFQTQATPQSQPATADQPDQTPQSFPTETLP